jgi:Na+/H+ antiporter NhaD/arsenite permease-like protein
VLKEEPVTIDAARLEAQTLTSTHRRLKRSFAARLFARERALFFAALVVAGAAAGLGAPVDFVLFGLVLAGVALFHHHTLPIALLGLAAIVAYKLAFTGFAAGPGPDGLVQHLNHEWVTLTNLLGLLLGFAVLAKHFEDSHAPAVLPRLLPEDWRGAFLLLVAVFVLSSFLDNIAAALIGGTLARAVFRDKVHIGYLAAIVAAANGGGSGSVVGDTTTTMMWIDGVSPTAVVHAYVAAVAALLVSGLIAARQQHAHAPVAKQAGAARPLDWPRLGIVAFILVATVAANVLANMKFPEWLDRVPVIGAAVWIAILLTTPLRRPDWTSLPAALRGGVFLLALVLCASLMPVDTLPDASWQATLGLGFVSSVFDNIPLTALALEQGGYDWGVLAYAVGFGGSMLWFGSSAGVALANAYPETRSVGRWLTHAWHVPLAYVAGFIVLLTLLGWHPAPEDAGTAPPPSRPPDVITMR